MKRALLLTVCLIFAAAPAMADDDLDAKIKRFFDRFDSNKDGVVDNSEFGDAKLFGRLDVNKDGKITAEDFQPQGDAPKNEPKTDAPKGNQGGDSGGTSEPKMDGPKNDRGGDKRGKQERFKMDANGDGKVSMEEWQAAFKKLDKNGDGSLSHDELMAMRGGKNSRRGGGKDGGQMGDRAKKMFERFDKNGDGVITKDEAPERMPFDRIDADGDGKITKEEISKMRGRRGGGDRGGR